MITSLACNATRARASVHCAPNLTPGHSLEPSHPFQYMTVDAAYVKNPPYGRTTRPHDVVLRERTKHQQLRAAGNALKVCARSRCLMVVAWKSVMCCGGVDTAVL